VLDKRRQSNHQNNLENLNNFMVTPLKICLLLVEKSKSQPEQVEKKIRDVLTKYIIKLSQIKILNSFPRTYNMFISEELVLGSFFKALPIKSEIRYSDDLNSEIMELSHEGMLILDQFLATCPDEFKRSLLTKIIVIFKGNYVYKACNEHLKQYVDPTVQRFFKLLDNDAVRLMETYKDCHYTMSNNEVVEFYKCFHSRSINDFVAVVMSNFAHQNEIFELCAFLIEKESNLSELVKIVIRLDLIGLSAVLKQSTGDYSLLYDKISRIDGYALPETWDQIFSVCFLLRDNR
jgi:hypothetical protein